LGQKQTSDIPHTMSALRLLAGIFFVFHEKDKLFAGE
jgi:hypothetical protein